MELEPITRQEQIIAGKDLEPITRMEKFLKEYGGGGGGGASHWNELEGKPFVTVGGDTLEWDGNTEGKPIVWIDELGGFIKVSDVTPSITDFVNGFFLTLANDTTLNATADMVMDLSGEGIPVLYSDYGLVVALEEGADFDGLVFPETGIYSIYSSDGTDSFVSLTIPGYTGFTKEQIDPAVLPDALQFGDTLAECMPETEIIGTVDDGSMVEFFAGKYTNYPSITFPIDSIPEKAVIVFDGVTYNCNLIMYLDFFHLYGNASIPGIDPEAPDTGEPFAFLPLMDTMGILFLKDEEVHTVSISVSAVKRVAEKYLPTRKTFCLNWSTSSDIYLYTDTTWTTKVTMEDLQAADKMYGFCIQMSGLAYSSCYAYVLGSSAEGGGVCDYAAVTVFMGVLDGTPTWKTYYTDKYTPPATAET